MGISQEFINIAARALLDENSAEQAALRESTQYNVLQPLRDTLEYWLDNPDKLSKEELKEKIVEEYLARIGPK